MGRHGQTRIAVKMQSICWAKKNVPGTLLITTIKLEDHRDSFAYPPRTLVLRARYQQNRYPDGIFSNEVFGAVSR